jgi:uncharacterized membrane protein (DUF485 family)
MIFFRIFVLVGMIRLLIATDKPRLCAGIYGSVVTAGALLSGQSVPTALIGGVLAFFLSGVYFWLLNRFDSGLLWWVVLVCGFLIGLI